MESPEDELLDRDSNPNLRESEIVGAGLQRLRWRRYEIESYLIHPATLERFAEQQIEGREIEDSTSVEEARDGLRRHLAELFQESFLEHPLEPSRLVENYLSTVKARTEILPAILDAAGLPGIPYTRYSEIAAVMQPDEIHPEIIEKLDAVCGALDPSPKAGTP